MHLFLLIWGKSNTADISWLILLYTINTVLLTRCCSTKRDEWRPFSFHTIFICFVLFLCCESVEGLFPPADWQCTEKYGGVAVMH